MNKFIIFIVVVIALVTALMFTQRSPSEGPSGESALISDSDTVTMNNVQIDPIEHASVILTWAGAVIYADPVGGVGLYAGKAQPDVILLTDIHGDHLDAATLEALTADGTTMIVPQAVADELPEALAARTKVLSNGEKLKERGFSIQAIPMYNLPDAENSNFHPKGRGNGYVVEKDGTRVYIAGDTAGIPEMRALKDIDIAFVPMNLPYTMDVDEAADAVLEFKPGRVIPYHYRGPDGLSDVNRFKELVQAGDPNIEVALLEWYR